MSASSTKRWAVLSILTVTGIGGGFWLNHRPSDGQGTEQSPPAVDAPQPAVAVAPTRVPAPLTKLSAAERGLPSDVQPTVEPKKPTFPGRSAEELLETMTRLSVVSSDGTQDAAMQREMALSQATKALELAGEFDRFYPDHPRATEVALLRTRLSVATGKGGISPAERAAELQRIAANPSAPLMVRARASQEWLVLKAEEVRSGHTALKVWEASARAHLEKYPENPSEQTIVSSLLADLTAPATPPASPPAQPSSAGKLKGDTNDQG